MARRWPPRALLTQNVQAPEDARPCAGRSWPRWRARTHRIQQHVALPEAGTEEGQMGHQWGAQANAHQRTGGVHL